MMSKYSEIAWLEERDAKRKARRLRMREEWRADPDPRRQMAVKLAENGWGTLAVSTYANVAKWEASLLVTGGA